MIVATCEILLFGLLITGAVLDLTTFRLPNWLTLATALVGLPWIFMVNITMHGVAMQFAGAGVMLVVGILAFRFNVLGGGDAKWLASLALWVGLNFDLMRFVMITTLAGAVLAVITLVISKLRPGYGLQDGKIKLPYGVAIAVAGVDFLIRRGELGQGLIAVAFG